MKRPFLLLGDGPNEPSGLGRIARDLAAQLVRDFGEQIDLLHVGGPTLPRWTAWPHLPLTEADRGEEWGAAFVEAAYRETFGDRPGILFAVWDASRLYPYAQIDLPVERWMYSAVDGANHQGGFGGPAAEAVRRFDRVLGYGRWGSRVLHCVRQTPIPYLPHGLSAAAWETSVDERGEARLTTEEVRQYLGPAYKGQALVGAVATNQARKDLGLFCHTLRVLLDRGWQIYGWLHTDTLVKAWSLPQLLDDFGLRRHLTIRTGIVEDALLRELYAASSVTIAPGLAEGFGYPIVESLATGTPVVHVGHGGGRELVPVGAWRFPVREMRFDGLYGLQRPVCRAEDVANAIERAWTWEAAIGTRTARAYCRGSVGHLAWGDLWPKWAGWIRQGLTGVGA